jgi:diguanylate cyclase (GGDEF)-like protein/PAS domain S-box-containing protein
MNQPPRLLIVDRTREDVNHLLRSLDEYGCRVSHSVAADVEAMRANLMHRKWDAIICRHAMPHTDAAAALRLAREFCPDIPFIIVSADMDLHLAISLIKAGAQDFIGAHELFRLGHVIDRELREAVANRERRYIQSRLRESEQMFRAIVENVGDMVVLLDPDGRRLYNSPSYGPLFPAGEIEVGSNSFQEVHPEDRERIREVFRRTVATGRGERAEFRFVLKDGSIRQIESDGRAILGPDGKVSKVIVVSRDITQRKAMESQLIEMATTDFLTGLPNRRQFLSRLEGELARLQRQATTSASVLMLDVDHFKLVNDRHGHAAGDDLLRRLGEVIRGELRKTDTAGRIGGEEFAIVLPGASVQAAGGFAERLRQKVMDMPLQQEGEHTVSIGVAALLAGDASAEAVLARADRALYLAKDNGRNRVEIAAQG